MKSQTAGLGNFTKTYFSVVFSVFLLVFLVANIIASQTIHPLYFKLVNPPKMPAEKFQDVTTYLVAIESLPQYQNQMEYYKSLYGTAIEESVMGPKNERLLIRQSFEQILQKSPKSRDILYSLFVFYSKEGDQIKAQEYLRQAREVDPEIED